MTRSEETNTIRVLIADDQPLQRAGQALILESADDIHVVAEAGNGEQAISLARTHRPDVVLMDVRMPGIGGIEATGIITRDLPGTRVIVLTTFDLDEYAFGSLLRGQRIPLEEHPTRRAGRCGADRALGNRCGGPASHQTTHRPLPAAHR